MAPVWLLDVFAALMLAVAAVSAARLVAARPWRGAMAAAGADVAHLLMAVAMAGMLTPSLAVVPDTAWEAVFGLMTAWLAWRVWRDARAKGVRALAAGHCAPHLVHSGSMLYMLLALAAPASGSSMPALEYPTLALAFALALAGYSVRDLDQLSGRRYGLDGASLRLAPAGVPAMAGAELAGTSSSGPPAMGQTATTSTLSAERAVPAGEPGDRAGLRSLLLSAATAAGCRVVMGTAMAFMLVIMI